MHFMHPLPALKVLVFDVFGTVVDWRSGITAASASDRAQTQPDDRFAFGSDLDWGSTNLEDLAAKLQR